MPGAEDNSVFHFTVQGRALEAQACFQEALGLQKETENGCHAEIAAQSQLESTQSRDSDDWAAGMLHACFSSGCRACPHRVRGDLYTCRPGQQAGAAQPPRKRERP